MKKFIRKFILWYMEKEEFNSFITDTRVVRVFTRDWYDSHIRNIGWHKVTDLNYAIDLLRLTVEEIETIKGDETQLTSDIKYFLDE